MVTMSPMDFIFDSKCAYMAHADYICQKCGRKHDGENEAHIMVHPDIQPNTKSPDPEPAVARNPTDVFATCASVRGRHKFIEAQGLKPGNGLSGWEVTAEEVPLGIQTTFTWTSRSGRSLVEIRRLTPDGEWTATINHIESLGTFGTVADAAAHSKALLKLKIQCELGAVEGM